MAELTTMGALAEQCIDSNNENLSAIISSLDNNYPTNWRDWKVYNYTFEDLFGASQVTPTIEAKLRFAIPTVDLARAFNPSATSLSERSYRAIRTSILKWPLGRALLYAPHHIMEKIHAPSYEVFMNTVKEIKPKLAKRREASQELERLSPETSVHSVTTKRSNEVVPEAHHSQTKRFCGNMPSSPIHTDLRAPLTQGGSDHLLASVLKQQMLLFNKMLSMQSEQNENIKTILHNQQLNTVSNTEQSYEDLNKSFDSLPDSTQSDEENDGQVEKEIETTPVSDGNESREIELRKKIAEVQRELATLTKDTNCSGTSFDFTPTTTEQEPKVARADPLAVKHGLSCQKLGDSSWRNVRYAETQKRFQATPVFTSLKTNNLLAELTPSWKSVEILERTDLTLGAITNGLIQQRMIFQNLLESLPSEVKNVVGRDFIAANSEFRKSSDALIQYVCGRRAEVIKQRREVYKPPNKAFREILHDIPPSGTHLFEEKSLTEVIKDLGGVQKIFPPKRRTYTSRKPIPQMSKSKSNQSAPYRFRDSRIATKRNPPYREADRKGRQQKPFHSKTERGKKDGGGRK